MAQDPRPLNAYASAQHYFGSELRRLRENTGLSQDDLGDLIRYSGDTVSKVEKAERWPRDVQQFAVACDRVLDADGTLTRLLPLVLAERVRLKRDHSEESAPPLGVSTPTLPDELPHPAAALVPLAGVLPLASQPLGEAADEAKDDQVLRLFLGLQAQLGGDDLYEPLARHTDRLSNALRQRGSRTRLAALGRLQQMAGWLAVDSNRHGQARQHLTAALYIAHEVDDTPLAASALAYMSIQQVYLDNHGKALSLARTAADTALASVSPLVAAMLGTRLARAHARLGHRSATLAALDEAYAHLGRAGDQEEPVWISYVDEVEVSAQAGACYLDLGMAVEAEQTLHLALGLLDQQASERTRDRVHYLSRLARTSLLKGDVDEACTHADEAVLHAETVGSARVLERLGEVADALRSFGGHPAASEVTERISLLTGPRPS